MKKIRRTTIIEKAIASLVNVLIVSIFSFVVFYLFKINKKFLDFRFLFIMVFLIYNLLFLFFNENRCLGMIIVNTFWDKHYSYKNNLVYLILYTLSFATIFYWVFFPFDLLLFNMILIQLPTIYLTGTTLHGFLSGNMTTIKKI